MAISATKIVDIEKIELLSAVVHLWWEMEAEAAEAAEAVVAEAAVVAVVAEAALAT